MMPSQLGSSVRYIKGVGPRMAELLRRLGVLTVKDLIFFFPRDWVDRRNVVPISKLNPGEVSLIKGTVTKIKANRTRGGFTIIKAAVMDKTGVVYAAWFNQPFMQNILKRGLRVFISGKAEFNSYSAEMEINVRDYEVLGDGAEDALPILPKYPLTEGLQQKRIRKIIQGVLSDNLQYISDPLPPSLRSKLSLMDLRPAILGLHFPKDLETIKPAQRRLAFDDFFVFQLGLLLRRKAAREGGKGIRFVLDGELTERFQASLPFKLTGAQLRVMDEIKKDMGSDKPMLRLLQGDVGCGKTIVAALSMVIASQSGYQAAIMAPTEILAQQHYSKLRQLLEPLKIKVGLLVSGIKASEKKKILSGLEGGAVNVIVGTHALIEEKAILKKLGLVVIDEQHRFGVVQRSALMKKGASPDVLVMTATPIPRSLALTLYGDLDRSVIDEMPPGRVRVMTVHVDEAKRQKAYEFIRTEVKRGRQVFVVCPLIEESEALDLKAAKLEAASLQKVIFPEFKVGLLHGRLKTDEKDEIMRRFKGGDINILVSTTVIEVGIDIPNATIMLIEHAERFGLSQLHQLRGRIGRGAEKSYCLIASDPRSEGGKARIAAMLSTNDGFKLAEEDLKIRGPGDFYGVRQAGLPAFRVADIIADVELLKIARAAAKEVLSSDPDLSRTENELLRNELKGEICAS